jgi:hypothetical protein
MTSHDSEISGERDSFEDTFVNDYRPLEQLDRYEIGQEA